MSDLENRTRFEPSEVEPRIIERWLASGLFHPESEGDASENYSIAIPPPNVTGELHMGHALNGSIQDALIRYHRMLGRRTRWIFGTDHAGIATQTQVEKALVAEGSSREEIGREAFIDRVWSWREQYGSTIVEQFKRLGASADYVDERFTLDDAYVAAVMKVFVDLYDKGYIYRDRYMVNWDPGSRSAISDLEVEDREVEDVLYSIAYPLASGEGEIVVATVRPETMLADTAVAVHPDDDRYRGLVGQEAILPLVGRRLPIVADEYVKPDFGSGALKITPGHDPNDFEIGQRHGLDKVTVIGEDGRMTVEAGERFAGLTVDEARAAVVAELEGEGLLRDSEALVHEVPFSHRSGQRIEPLISLQWFMRMDELARPAIEAVTAGRTHFHPERFARVYLDWMESIRPWCISRQLWWGHQLPVWYRDGETYVGTTAPAGEGWERDPDVLDTWFSSALWPFATLGWPDQTPALRAFYPTDALVTGRDIIFLWVARMMMMGLEFPGQEPFSDVYITSTILAPDGRRMSKSLGTGIDPLEDIEKHGADAVRFGLLAMSSTQDVKYSREKIAQGQALANKLFNAARLVLLRLPEGVEAAPRPRTLEDRWILSRLQSAITETTAHLESFAFSHAALGVYDFVYGELCDWYLELVKPRLYAEEVDDDLAATLVHVLADTLRLAHPILPFVTEEIWSHVPATSDLLAADRYPMADQGLVDPQAEVAMAGAIDAIKALRAWRDEVSAPAGAVLPARFDANGDGEAAEHVARLARLDFSAGEGEPIATVPVPGGAVAMLASDAVDLAGRESRRQERLDKLAAEIARTEGKLANEGFVAKAPPEVVEAEREKLTTLRAERDAL
ncbi:MAG: valyl-tRNA synthetase [Solirubrobacteraceae bacterium]|jgi:valyl-tRNA synthetase|nr:valyl-tRNA synthetase [Solirubrobacteraceae bacterium]